MHASEGQIIDHVLGDVDTDVAAHVAECAECQAEVEEFRGVLALIDHAPEMPEDFMDRVRRRAEPQLRALRRPPRRRWNRRWMAIAATVAMLVIAALIAWQARKPAASQRAPLPRVIARKAPPSRPAVKAPSPAPAPAPPAVAHATAPPAVPAPAPKPKPAPPVVATIDLPAPPSAPELPPLFLVSPSTTIAPTGLNPPHEPGFDRERWFRFGAERNFFIDRADRLPGNVGYLRVSAFFFENLSSRALAQAMDFLSRTDSLIIDLRHTTPAGDVAMAELFVDYFRAETDKKGGEKYLDRDVFVLVSFDDFCAPEGVARALQTMRRATVVGERTRGSYRPRIATRGRTYDIPCPSWLDRAPGDTSDHPLTPDIYVLDEKALEVAYLEALNRLNTANPKSDLAHERYRAISNVTHAMKKK